MNLSYTDRAETDIDIAMGWYENQRQGLGIEFLNCLEEAGSRILESPELYSVKYKRLRGVLVRRFPFTVFYTIEKTEILVHAVFDNRKDPEKRP